MTGLILDRLVAAPGEATFFRKSEIIGIEFSVHICGLRATNSCSSNLV